MATDWVARIRLEEEHKGRWQEFYSVPSTSNPDLTYVVAKDGHGEWGCSCPRWIYHREQCKHINRVLQALKNQAKVQEAKVADLSVKAKKAFTRMARIELDKDAEPITLANPDSDRAAYLEI